MSTLLLNDMGLAGPLDLGLLSDLCYLNFVNNSFDCGMPAVTKLPDLKSIYLLGNRLSGQLRDDLFQPMRALKKVWLSRNDFSGQIASILVSPEKLMEVGLDGNMLEGEIPALWQPDLHLVNVAFNNLEGPIMLITCLLSRCRSQKESAEQPQSGEAETIDRLEGAGVQAGAGAAITERRHGRGKKVPKKEQGKLSFVSEERRNFDLSDLLRASAEVLGSGNFGSSYKAFLDRRPRHRRQKIQGDERGGERRLPRTHEGAGEAVSP